MANFGDYNMEQNGIYKVPEASIRIVDVNQILNKPIAPETNFILQQQPLTTNGSVRMVDINKILQGSVSLNASEGSAVKPAISLQLGSLNNVINKQLQKILIPIRPQLNQSILKSIKTIPEVRIVDVNDILSQKTNSDSNIVKSNLIHTNKNEDSGTCTRIRNFHNSQSSKLPSLIKASDNLYFVPIVDYRQADVCVSNSDVASLLETPNIKPLKTAARVSNNVCMKDVPYQCLNFRKRPCKIDLEGFTAYDRAGFLKVERQRARRCSRILGMFVKTYENVVQRLVKKFQRFESELNDVKLVQEPVVNHRGNKSSLSKTLSTRQKRKCRILPKWQIILPFSTLKLDDFSGKRIRSTTVFIHDENLIKISHFNEKSCFQRKKVFFVNTNNIQTCLYMETFPSFQRAVLSGRVKVVDNAVFDFYSKRLKRRVTSNLSAEKSSDYGDKNTNECGFTEYVKNFHASFQDNVNFNVKLEHSYSVPV